MYTERFLEPHPLGLERFTHSNAGRFFCNERTEQVEETADGGFPAAIDASPSGQTTTYYVYDVYEVADARDPHQVKNSVITEEHPFGDETKILRKALAKALKYLDLYATDTFAEFRAYNEFCENV